MRAAIGVLAVLAGWWTAAAADEKYESKEGKFKVAIPKGVKVVTSQEDGGNGQKLNAFKAEHGEKLYMMTYFDRPGALKDVPAKELLDALQKGFVQMSG